MAAPHSRVGRRRPDHESTLSKYTVELQDDHKHLREVSNPHLADTPFRSPQLTLIDLGPHEWLLYRRTSDYAPARGIRRVPGIVQLPLFDLPQEEKFVGADEGSSATRPRTHLHLVPKPSESQGTEE